MTKKTVPPHEIVKSEKLSTYREDRFVVVNPETGELLDDANGYGYKSRQKAHAGFGYKSTHTKKQTEKEKAQAHAWWNKHKELSRLIDDEAFCAIKDGTHFEYKDFKELLEGQDLEGLTPQILWRYY